jgi:hypothetical protein
MSAKLAWRAASVRAFEMELQMEDGKGSAEKGKLDLPPRRNNKVSTARARAPEGDLVGVVRHRLPTPPFFECQCLIETNLVGHHAKIIMSRQQVLVCAVSAAVWGALSRAVTHPYRQVLKFEQ